MAEYGINKGIGRPAEFRGLKSQYLFIFAGIGFGIVAGLSLTFFTFRLNAKYGTHGMMKHLARGKHPRRIRSDKSVLRILKTQAQW